MKRLLTLVFALLVTFTLMGCEGETIIEERIEVVEVERIVIETVTEKLTDEQIATMEEVIEIKLDKKYKEEYSALEEDLIKTYNEDLQKAIDELEPEIIYETIVKTEIEYVDRVEYKTEYVTVTNTDLVDELTEEIAEIDRLAKSYQIYMGVDEEVIYDTYQDFFLAMGSIYNGMEDGLQSRITELEAIVNDEIAPVIGQMTLTNDIDNNLVLTISTWDNVGYKSLQVDELTFYPETSEQGEVSMVYTNGLWTINFGVTMTTQIRLNPTIEFNFVLKDLANHKTNMTYEFVVPAPVE